MNDNPMLKEAVEALSKGQRARAKDLLTRLLKADQANFQYWLYMSSVVESDHERIYCLENVLKLDPGNRAAQQGLVLLGARPPGEDVRPVPPVRRRWSAVLSEDEIPKTRWQKIYSNKILRAGAFTGLAAVVVGLFWLGFFGVRNLQGEPVVIYRVTITPGLMPTFTATPSAYPTATRVVRSPTPTFAGPTPLWMFLEATYTPVPLYVNTPHPVNEAYRIGIRSYSKGDWAGFLRYMQQAAAVDRGHSDIHYHIGEAYRLQGQPAKALENYELAISYNPAFAPSYLGRALANLALGTSQTVQEDLDTAVEYDPQLVDAYFARAAYKVEQGNTQAALEDLAEAEILFPDSPQLYLNLSLAYYSMGDYQAAIENAEISNRMDITLLPAYLALSRSYLASGQTNKAAGPLKTYLLYEKKDPVGWITSGILKYRQGRDYQAALEAIDQALSYDKTLTEGFFYRGLVNLALDQPQEAVNDLLAAQKLDGDSFWINLELGHAMLAANRPNDAYRHLRSIQDMAEDDGQRAALHYWRAMALEVIGNRPAAAAEWEALIDLPEESLPEGWLVLAGEHLQALLPPTATLTPTRPSATPTSTSTATKIPPTLTRTPTPSSTPTRTPTVTPTAQPTRTPAVTSTPTGASTAASTKSSPTKTPSPAASKTPTRTPSPVPPTASPTPR